MIDINRAKKYCCEDISLIENYDKAISSDETYDCHHRNEITLGESVNGLKEMGLYWNRPANELIFLTHSEHMTLHYKGKHHTEETRKKMSESLKGENHPLYGKHHSEETRNKMSEAHNGKNNSMYGKQHSEETRKKMADAVKGSKWMNNGQNQKYVKPDEVNLYLDKGYSLGRLTK